MLTPEDCLYWRRPSPPGRVRPAKAWVVFAGPRNEDERLFIEAL
jgi:hypothetical protein